MAARDEAVRCIDCANFQPSNSSLHGLGRCGAGGNWDGFVGQWPFKHHRKCKSFQQRER
jgi:hypothetical protein